MTFLSVFVPYSKSRPSHCPKDNYQDSNCKNTSAAIDKALATLKGTEHKIIDVRLQPSWKCIKDLTKDLEKKNVEVSLPSRPEAIIDKVWVARHHVHFLEGYTVPQ